MITNKSEVLIISLVILLIIISGFVTLSKKYTSNNYDNDENGFKCSIYNEGHARNEFLKNYTSTDDYKKAISGY